MVTSISRNCTAPTSKSTHSPGPVGSHVGPGMGQAAWTLKAVLLEMDTMTHFLQACTRPALFGKRKLALEKGKGSSCQQPVGC